MYTFNEKVLSGESARQSPLQGCKDWSELMAPAEEAKNFQWGELPGDKCHKAIALNYSSGTTGVPQGVEVTHFNYIANTLYLVLLFATDHAMAQTIFIAGSLLREIPVNIMAKMMLKNIQRFKITELTLVPPIAVTLVKHPATKKFDLSSIESACAGAAPLNSETCRALEKICGKRFNMRQGWAMTEESASFGVGEPNANCEAMIMRIETDAQGNESFSEVTARGPEHTGELWVRGPNVMKGYWRNPEATAKTFSNDGKRWLRTGDVAYVDEGGCFYIVDRIKELIKVKGNQVAPAELEALLLEHPGIAAAAVIGIPTADGDEKPRGLW
ncbi:hypothetical protein PV08_08218 [Exophiala spinifera]|uniref:AMP-dependent synthetase/ligase domain-containing protein n=1 Tax=Exophiala spinifera TaxID=91928 RepID=A0A0D1YDI4_9EURO|nr:uncharacterized protein PV08_08218 [Exophiala spinifera]KIW13031.1 hypothetical protein PV08_08218 [Exophiala spinifera]